MSDLPQAQMVTRTKKIFVGGLSASTVQADLNAYFSTFGKVEEAMLMFDRQTNRHRGFGFVTFDSEEAVEKVCQLHYHEINNKTVECKKAQPKEVMMPQAQKNTRLNQAILVPGGPTPAFGFGMPGMYAINTVNGMALAAGGQLGYPMNGYAPRTLVLGNYGGMQFAQPQGVAQSTAATTQQNAQMYAAMAGSDLSSYLQY